MQRDPTNSQVVYFEVPDYMMASAVAHCLAAYLSGHRAFIDDPGRTQGPYQDDVQARDGRWQLDTGNDYFLRFEEDGRGKLSCRYESGCETIRLMAELFEERYVRRFKR